jgi:hypothetical protein
MDSARGIRFSAGRMVQDRTTVKEERESEPDWQTPRGRLKCYPAAVDARPHPPSSRALRRTGPSPLPRSAFVILLRRKHYGGQEALRRTREREIAVVGWLVFQRLSGKRRGVGANRHECRAASSFRM